MGDPYHLKGWRLDRLDFNTASHDSLPLGAAQPQGTGRYSCRGWKLQICEHCLSPPYTYSAKEPAIPSSSRNR